MGVVEDAIADSAALLQESYGRALAEEPSVAAVMIVVCSEHGFAGAFNKSLLDLAVAKLAPGQQLGIVGRRGALLAEERNLDIAWRFPTATHVGGVLGVTRRVADNLAGVSRADIVFGQYRKGGHFDAEAKRILPLDPELLVGLDRLSRPLHHLDADSLLQRLAEEYLFAEITRAAMESLASENGARLRVMEAADKNIGDKLDILQRHAQSLRQETITSELLDVVIGAEAILDQQGERLGR